MSKQPVAYLVGGPFDLTKMTLSDKKQVIRMAEPVRAATRAEIEANIPMEFEYIEYRLVGCAFRDRYTGSEVLIYVYSEVLDA